MILEIMNEVTKKALEYGLSFMLLIGISYYLHEQINEQKKEFTQKIDGLSERLQSCESDKLNLSKDVEGLRVKLDLLTSGSVLPRKQRK